MGREGAARLEHLVPMPVFSVITAVQEGGDAYLLEAFESLASQRLPRGWSLQWLVQEDGKTGKPLGRLADKPWISKGASETSGVARTRTLALHRTEGVLTRALGADDLLPDEFTLARDVEALAANPDLGWTVAPTLELAPDGRLTPGPFNPPPGRLSSGFIAEGLRARTLPIMHVTATIYTQLVVAHGGWLAVPPCEDVGALLDAEAVVGGWMQENPGKIYRQGPGQPECQHGTETATGIGLALARADAIRELGWRWQPREPVTI